MSCQTTACSRRIRAMAESGRGCPRRVLAIGLLGALVGTGIVFFALQPSSEATDNASTKGVRPTTASLKQTAPPPYHHVFVVCVGINANPAYGNLAYAVADAEKLADVCRSKYGFNNV